MSASVGLRRTVMANSDEVVLHDGSEEIVPVLDGFTRLGTKCSLDDPELVVVVAGPRANGCWVTVVLDAEPRLTVH